MLTSCPICDAILISLFGSIGVDVPSDLENSESDDSDSSSQGVFESDSSQGVLVNCGIVFISGVAGIMLSCSAYLLQ